MDRDGPLLSPVVMLPMLLSLRKSLEQDVPPKIERIDYEMWSTRTSPTGFERAHNPREIDPCIVASYFVS